MNFTYDLRSDTITKPDKNMKDAMFNAIIGDDVFFEDESTNKLEQKSAKMFGKEAALFVPSGSMGNLIAMYINGGKANEILMHNKAHIINFELASIGAVVGAMPIAVKGERGILHPEELKKHLRANIYYLSKVSMVCAENTHNLEGGTCYSLEDLKNVYSFCKENNLKFHIDGARIFNAIVKMGYTAEEVGKNCDTITFCLSKGLSAPVGSVLVGDAEFIKKARTVRKMLGGAMRQTGFLAEAGIYALDNNISKLKEDHDNAILLAQTFSNFSWAKIDSSAIETNIGFVYLKNTIDAHKYKKIMEDNSIGMLQTSPDSFRFVTNSEIRGEKFNNLIKILKNINWD